MARLPLGDVLNLVRRSAGRAEATDQELLGSFLARRDESAFTELVRRHGPLVLGVCRRVLRHTQDAEDAFQATFLVLARKAGSLRRRDQLGNWLYGVAYRVARRARDAAARRRAHDAQVPAAECWAAGFDDRHELRALLDRAVSRLPDKYRVPVVLCELEGRPRREVARALRLPEGTLSSRLAAARRILARRLAPFAPAAFVALAHADARDVSPTLLTSTLNTVAGRATGSVPTAVAALAQGGLTEMLPLRSLCALAVLALTAGLVSVPGGPSFDRAAGTPAIAAEDPPQAAPAPADDRPILTLNLDGNVVGLAWSPDGRQIATRSIRPKTDPPNTGDVPLLSTIRFWDARTGDERLSLGEVDSSGEIQVAFSPDGRFLAISFRQAIQTGDKVELWDVASGKLVRSIHMDYGRSPPRFAFSPDGKRLAVAYGGPSDRLTGGARVFDVDTGKELLSVVGHKSLVISVAFSPDGRLLATGGEPNDGTVRIWDMESGRLRSQSESLGGALALAFSPDGKLLAAGSSPDVRVFDATTGRLIAELPVRGKCHALAFSPDGRTLATAGPEGDRGPGRVQLWDVASHKLLRTWDGTATGAIAFAPDGSALAIGYADHTVKVWRLGRAAAGAATPKTLTPMAGVVPSRLAKLLGELLQSKRSDREITEALYLATIGRLPNEREVKPILDHIAERGPERRREALEDALWALVNSLEFRTHAKELADFDPLQRPKK